MSKFEYATPAEISDHERLVLEAKRDVCFDSIHGVSLRWLVVADANDRRLFQLTDYSRPTMCYFEALLDEIETMEDSQFKNAIVANERPCSDAQL